MIQITEYPPLEKIKIFTEAANGKPIIRELLTRDFLQKTYVDLNFGIDELLKIYGITYSVFYKAYIHWFTKEERKKIGGTKIAKSQVVNNSNNKNTGIPRKLLSKSVLQELLDKKYALEKISKILAVAPQTVTRSLRYYKLDHLLIRSGINYDTYLFAQKIDKMFGTNVSIGIEEISKNVYSDIVNNSLTDLVNILSEISVIEQGIKKIKRNFLWKINKEKSHKDGLYNFPTSLVNKKVFSIIKELGIDVACEYKIENRSFDFIIKNTKFLLEIDPTFTHSSIESIENDSYKNELAKKHGYTVIRIKLKNDEGFNSIKTKLTECFYNLKLLK